MSRCRLTAISEKLRSRDELLRLAEKLETMAGPDREADALIVTTLCPGATVSEYIRGEGDDIVFHAEALGISNKDCCPWFTTSLDAAMTLVPESWAEYTLTNVNGYHEATLTDHTAKRTAWASSEATPALAVASAALKARANQEPGQ